MSAQTQPFLKIGMASMSYLLITSRIIYNQSIMRVLLALWMTLASCMQVNVETVLLGVLEPIDVVALSNQSLVVANRTQLYLLDAVGRWSIRLVFNPPSNEPILGLEALKDYLCISTSGHLYLLFQSNLTLFQDTTLPSFREYLSVAFSEAEGQIFYIPIALNQAEFIEYRWTNKQNTRFISKENIQNIQYLDRQFVLVGSQSGNVSTYNTSSKGQIGEDEKLCETIARLQVVDSESGVVICEQGKIWVGFWEATKWNYTQLQFKGYSVVAYSEESIFLANNTHFLFRSPSIHAFTYEIANLSKIIYAAFLNKTQIAVLDQDNFLLITISDSNDSGTSDLLPIICYAAGGAAVLLCLACLWKRSRKRAKQPYNTDESQLTVLLIDDK